MKNLRLFIVCLLGINFVLPLTTFGSAGFDRYRIILTRKPFGEAPPPEKKPERVVPPGESFARIYRMCALLEVEDGGLRIGLVNSKTKEDFFLGVGEVKDGVELVSASYEDEEAVLKKGSEMVIIKLQSGEIQSLAPSEQKKRLERKPKGRLSYAERRKAREERRRAKPPPKPKYEGAELEKHLQEYQMEVIRQGLPPLPIPLTPEMDDQLVSEGVLPPVE